MMKTPLSILAPAFLALGVLAVCVLETRAVRDEPTEKRIEKTIAIENAPPPGATEVKPPVDVASKPKQMDSTVYSKWPFDEREARRRQEETARAIGQPIEKTNSIGMKLTLIPAGAFMMGSPEGESERQKDEGPAHRVRITKPFYLGACEVTVVQFREFVNATGYKTDAEKDGKGGWGYTGDDKKLFKQDPKYTWRNPGFSQNADHPVVNVSWNDAVAFCGWLGGKESSNYRLPTEAEWEYACRAGSTSRYCFGDNRTQVTNYGWVKQNSRNAPQQVGKLRPNAWGLYDMHGNLCEWCMDAYDATFYARSPGRDPRGPQVGQHRVLRGGCFNVDGAHCASSTRMHAMPNGRTYVTGLRVVIDPPAQ